MTSARYVHQVVLALALAVLFAASPAAAKSRGIKFAADYSDMRGFNYNPVSARNGEDKWINYNPAEVDRDFGYAQRLNLKSVRMVLSYQSWLADRAGFDQKLKDFARTPYAH